METYFVSKRGGNSEGPHAETEIRRQLKVGDLAYTDLLCQDGWQQWEPIHKFFQPPLAAPLAPKNEPVPEKESSCSRGVYRVLAFFFGLAGVHNIYSGRMGSAVLQFLCTCTVVGLLISIPWVAFDFFCTERDGKGLKLR